MTPRTVSENNWIDVSVTLRNGMVNWPGDQPVRIQRIQDLENGDNYVFSVLSMSAHCGTHIDAPAHFLKDGVPVDKISLKKLIGPARVIEIKDRESIKPKELRGYRIRKGERILFKTRNSALWQKANGFIENYVYITIETAKYLAGRGTSVVGVDYLSVGGYHGDGEEVHRILLGTGIVLIEGLDLSAVEGGRHDLACLPLKIQNGDGAPARVALRRRLP